MGLVDQWVDEDEDVEDEDDDDEDVEDEDDDDEDVEYEDDADDEDDDDDDDDGGAVSLEDDDEDEDDDDDMDDEDALHAVSLQFIWLATCAACVVLGLDVGLLVGLLFQLGTVVVRTQL